MLLLHLPFACALWKLSPSYCVILTSISSPWPVWLFRKLTGDNCMGGYLKGKVQPHKVQHLYLAVSLPLKSETTVFWSQQQSLILNIQFSNFFPSPVPDIPEISWIVVFFLVALPAGFIFQNSIFHGNQEPWYCNSLMDFVNFFSIKSSVALNLLQCCSSYNLSNHDPYIFLYHLFHRKAQCVQAALSLHHIHCHVCPIVGQLSSSHCSLTSLWGSFSIPLEINFKLS